MKKETNKKKGKNGIGKKIALIIILILLVIGLFIGYRVWKNGGGLKGILATAIGHDSETLKNLPKIYCLLLGQSQNLTDTIMIAEYDPQEQQASILSIPRDTFIGSSKTNATTSDKINSLYSWGGAQKVLKEVNELTGLDIKYYLKVDTEAFKALVDAIGGVTFNVPIDMKYDDGKQNLHINLKAGTQLLDGDKAEQVVRFRHNNDGTTYPANYGIEDLGRMKTQRNFLMALAKQTLKIENVFKINEFIDIANKYVETNLDFNTIKDYVPYIVEFNVENLKTEHLPGVPGTANGWYFYLPYEDKVQKMVDDLFINPNKINKDELSTGSTVDTSNIDKSNIKIEVLNGTTSTSKLEKVVATLEKAGYKIEKTGNTTETSNTTVIKRGDLEEALQQELKSIAGVTSLINGENSQVTITIIIGKDYNN